MTDQPDFDFIAEAMKTASTHFHTDRVKATALYVAMRKAVAALDVVDKMRKAIFYENREYLDDGIPTLYRREYPTDVSPMLMHSILGAATEGGEKLDILIRAFDGEGFDRAVYIEQVGDGFWYDAIGLQDQDIDMEETMRICLAKIAGRNGGKAGFNKEAFNERDELTEAALLNSLTMPETKGNKVKVTK